MRLLSGHPLKLLPIALALLLTAPSPAQERTDFADVVHVNVVNVDVRVTDKAGDPVTDLEVGDFELLEDGKPVEISNFYAVVNGEPAGGAPDPAPDVEPVGEAAAGPPTQTHQEARARAPGVPPDQQLHLIIYVDNLNLRPLNRNRVVRALRDFVRRHVDEGDRTMVVTYERALHTRQPFTTDSAQLSRTLQELETMSAQGVHADSDRLDAVRAIQEIEDDARLVNQAVTVVQTYAESQYNDLMFTIDSLRDFVDLLAGLRGRKALLYVSDGIPQRPGEDLFYALNDVSQRFTGSRAINLTSTHRFDSSRRLQELAAQAASARVSFFTIDAGGLRAPTTGTVMPDRPGVVGPIIDSVYVSNRQAPLRLMAEATGGRVILNTNKFGPALDDISRDLSTYYSLGFQPGHYGDGRYHRLEVRVKRKGLRVHHREGYRDETVETRMGQSVMAGLEFGSGENALGARLQRGHSRRLEDGNYHVPVRVLVPISSLTLLPGEEHRSGRFRLFVAVQDGEGRSTPIRQVPVTVEIEDERWEAVRHATYPYELSLTVAPGEQRLAIGIRDELGAAEALLVETLSIGS